MTFSEPFRDGNRAHCAPGSVIGLCRRLSGPRIINTFVSLVWFDALSNTRCLAQFQTMLHNPLHNVTVATRSGHTVETYRQFKADIDHLFAQFLPDNSSRTKRDSVAIPLDHCACSPFMRSTAAPLCVLAIYAFYRRAFATRAKNGRAADFERFERWHRLLIFEGPF